MRLAEHQYRSVSAIRGPLLFLQVLMGQDCRPFIAYKFRTMRDNPGATAAEAIQDLLGTE